MQKARYRENRLTRNHVLGFTLIEVIVVSSIIALLAAIAYPTYQDPIKKARRTEGRAALMQLMQQEERFYSQHNTYIVFSSASTDVDEKKFKWFSGDTAPSSSYEIRADPCSGDVIQNCVLLSAKPGTVNVNSAYKDTECGDFTLSSTGIKSAAAANCW